MPRHPPYALKNLNTQNDQNKSQTRTRSHKETASSPEMLASTVQLSKNNRAHHNPPPRQRRGPRSPSPEAPRLSPVSSGPNSLPTQTPTRTRRSHSPHLAR